MKNMTLKPKEAVRLRCKRIRNGNFSLYLDIYEKGVRKYEFLRLYLVPEQMRSDRERNRHALQLANTVKARRIIEMQEEMYGNRQYLRKQRANFVDYIDRFAQEHKKAYRSLALGLKNHLIHYRGRRIPFCDINKLFLIGFRRYLRTAQALGNVSKYKEKQLSESTQWNYFNILSRLLNKAQREGYLSANPMHTLTPDERPRRGEPRKTYLVIKELRKLVSTPLRQCEVKQAFLFACLCGLRFSDVKRLEWSNLQTDSRGKLIAEIIQQKTGTRLYLPISAEAARQLPHRSTNEGLVFSHLPDASYTSRILKTWGRKAGLRKTVTFHVARHTFATLGLTYGADLYTMSKLLGHSNIRVTQIYADIISEKKRKAVDSIPSIG